MSSSNISRPAPRGLRRVGAVIGPVIVGSLFLAACGGGSDDAATQSTIDLSQASTAFVVRPPVTTVAPESTVPLSASQEYTVQSGDYPLKVANQFGVSVDDLIAFNEWASVNEFPFPGTVILIPPGGTAAPAGSTETETETGAEATGSTAPAETIPDAGDNCGEGEYTIVEGDYEGKVAAKFDVTIDALRAANANTSGYSSFYPGLVIVIPGKSDC